MANIFFKEAGYVVDIYSHDPLLPLLMPQQDVENLCQLQGPDDSARDQLIQARELSPLSLSETLHPSDLAPRQREVTDVGDTLKAVQTLEE